MAMAIRKSIKNANVLFFRDARGSWLAFFLISAVSAQDCMSEIISRAFSPALLSRYLLEGVCSTKAERERRWKLSFPVSTFRALSMSVKLHSSFSLSVSSICLRNGCESARSTLETSSEVALAIFKTFLNVR